MSLKITEINAPNSNLTPEEIVQQMTERRPLPTGRQEFMEWSDRIIAGAMLSAEIQSQRFALASMIPHLGPTESHKEDAYFIHRLRKSAADQFAMSMVTEIKEAHTSAKQKEEEEAAAKKALRDESNWKGI